MGRMQTFIALLRGINVGGHNKISMKALKEAFGAAGFSEVRTYINSGNVIFSSDRDERAVQLACANLIREGFGLTIAVSILTAEELLAALACAPDWWGDAPDTKHSAIFVIPPATAETVFAEVGEIKPDYEQCAYHGKLIFWSAPLKTFSRTRWGTVSKQSTQNITIRNSTTARKLAELVKE